MFPSRTFFAGAKVIFKTTRCSISKCSTSKWYALKWSSQEDTFD